MTWEQQRVCHNDVFSPTRCKDDDFGDVFGGQGIAAAVSYQYSFVGECCEKIISDVLTRRPCLLVLGRSGSG